MYYSHELGEDLLGEGAVLVVDEPGVGPALRVRRRRSHQRLLRHVGLKNNYIGFSNAVTIMTRS